MMKPATTLALALVLCAMPVAAQDPLITIPEAYKVQFENAWVKVVRVHNAAGAKLPVHTHPPGTTAYLYLNDSDGVVFRHESGSSRAVTRPPVKAGSMRVATGPSETHNAENPAATPSDFVKVHFKTASDGPRNLRRRIPRNAADVAPLIREEFSNAQMRIWRLIVAAGKSVEIRTPDGQPALLLTLMSGQERWVNAGQIEAVTNTGTKQMELIRIDLLTAPVAPVN
jgi:hypothetical protein